MRQSSNILYAKNRIYAEIYVITVDCFHYYTAASAKILYFVTRNSQKNSGNYRNGQQ